MSDIAGGADERAACAVAGCGNPGSVWIEIHDRAVPERVRVCYRHSDEAVKHDTCTVDGCNARAARWRKCIMHADGYRPMRWTEDLSYSPAEQRRLKANILSPK
jgi:hypothetical protein